MKYHFEITIKYEVVSERKLNEVIDFEYYAFRGDIRKDTVEFRDCEQTPKKLITITGDRQSPININECCYTINSNYKKAILSSLLYAYYSYGKRINIESIEMSVNNSNSVAVMFEQEFIQDLKPNCYIDLNIVKQIFNRKSEKNISELVSRLLCFQIAYLNRGDIYSAYRAFNAVYTFIYSWCDKTDKNSSNKKNGKADKDAIVNILKVRGRNMVELEQDFSKSIALSKIFFDKYEQDISNLIYKLIKDMVVNEQIFLAQIGYEQFQYRNETVQSVIKKAFNYLFKNSDELSLKKSITGYEINYLQVIIMCAYYKRNKVFHGEHEEPDFLIYDKNGKILSGISEIVFQLSIDLANSKILSRIKNGVLLS